MEKTRQDRENHRFSGRRLSQKRILQVIGQDEALPESADPKLTGLLAYWRSLAETGKLPARNALDPLSMPELLPYFLLLDVENRDFRFRLIGEAVNDRYGGKIKGKSLTELLSGDVLAETLDEHIHCTENAAPVFTCNTINTIDSDDRKLYQRLILPLSDNGEEVQSIAGVMHFER